MKHIEDKFTHTGIGELYYQGWLPEGEVRAVIQISHGLAEHGGRYINVVKQLVPLGFAVYAIDNIGHGRSSGPRAHVNRFEDFLTAQKLITKEIKQRHPGKKFFLLGHSMGGLIAAIYLLEHQDEFDGAVLSSPFVTVPAFVTDFTVFLAKVFSALAPKARLQEIPADGISRDPQEVQVYLDDPLVFKGKSTARMGAELLWGMQIIKAERSKIRLPLLIMHGTADFLAQPDETKNMFAEVSSTDKTLKLYEGYLHELFNEKDKEVPLSDLQAWLEAHL